MCINTHILTFINVYKHITCAFFRYHEFTLTSPISFYPYVVLAFFIPFLHVPSSKMDPLLVSETSKVVLEFLFTILLQ